jgi:hypothetical protein
MPTCHRHGGTACELCSLPRLLLPAGRGCARHRAAPKGHLAGLGYLPHLGWGVQVGRVLQQASSGDLQELQKFLLLTPKYPTVPTAFYHCLQNDNWLGIALWLFCHYMVQHTGFLETAVVGMPCTCCVHCRNSEGHRQPRPPSKSCPQVLPSVRCTGVVQPAVPRCDSSAVGSAGDLPRRQWQHGNPAATGGGSATGGF